MREKFHLDVYNVIIIALIPFVLLVAWGLTWNYERNLHAQHWALRHAQRTRTTHGDEMARLLAHVRDRGAVRASDFERKAKAASGWWEWKDEKRWLEALFALGDLMIARRERFQRVYDLSERVLAAATVPPGHVPGESEALREMRLRSIRALGITQARWVSDYYRLGPRVRDEELDPFVDAGELKETADYKIRAMFRLFAENSQCKQIYFAGCHDVGYVSELTPHVGNRDRITLVRSTTIHHEFSKLGMRIESFPNIFRLTPLDVHQYP